MLQRHHRLLAQVRLHHPKTFRSSAFIVKFAPNNLVESRFGFIIRKAIAKHSVKRNRVRRVLRSCVEERLNQIVSGYDMLFILQKESLEMERGAFLQEIEIFLTKNNLLR